MLVTYQKSQQSRIGTLSVWQAEELGMALSPFCYSSQEFSYSERSAASHDFYLRVCMRGSAPCIHSEKVLASAELGPG